MTASPTTESVRLRPATSFGLDLLRALAAQLVVLGHGFDFFGLFSHLGEEDPPPQIQRMAVVVFFLLSGFLIAYTTDRRRRAGEGFGGFLIARFSRIYSGLVPALLFIAAVDALPFHRFEQDYPADTFTLSAFFVNLFQLQELPGTDWGLFGTGDPLWTLAVEWWLYVLYGGLLLFLLAPYGWRRGAAAWIVVVPLLAVATVSVAGNLVGGTGHGIAVVWFLGVGAWLLWRRGGPSILGRGRLYAGAALLFVAGLLRAYRFAPAGEPKAFDFAFELLLGASFAALVLGLERDDRCPPVRLEALVGLLAGYSYTLYLTHFTVLTVLYELRGVWPAPVLLLIGLGGANGIAWLLYLVGERHHRRWRGWLSSRLSRVGSSDR